MDSNSAGATDEDELGPSSSKRIRLDSDLQSLAKYYKDKSNIKINKSNATETNEYQIFPPISSKIKVDSDLTYTSDRYAPVFNEKDKVKQRIKIYSDYKDKTKANYINLSDGWKFLTTAENTSKLNGYFGATFWNPEREQVVIAHRGTELTNIGAVWTDIQSIYRNKVASQISSAITFSHYVQRIFAEIDKEWGTHFKIFITGHSLGGWLAQICTFSVEYLTIMDDDKTYFVKSKEEGHHAHTVVFDSPGCKPMLQQLQREFDVRYDNIEKLPIDCLDITIYLSVPNRVNTCNPHVGKIYRMFVDFSKKSYFHTKQTHDIDKIIETFDENTGLFITENENGSIVELYNTISYIRQILIKYPEEKCENIKIKLLEFFKNSNKIVWKVDATKIENESVSNYSEKHCIVLDLKHILSTNRYIKILNFIKSTKNDNQLLIIEYNPNQADNNDDFIKKFFTNLFKEIKSSKSWKIIICAKQDHILKNILNTNLDKLYIETKDVDEIDQLIDHDTLVKLINDNNKIEIGNKNFGIENLEGAYADLYKELNNETLKLNIIKNSIKAIYFISGLFENNDENSAIEELGNILNFERNIIADKINYLKSPNVFQFDNKKYIYLIDSQFKEEDFNKLCDKHLNDKIMFWIKWDNEKFIIQRLYNPNFYIKRKFHSVLLNIDKKMLKTDECFVFSGVDCVETLATLFNDSSIKTNKKIFIKLTSEDAEVKFDKINGIVHWIEVKTVGSNIQLVWRDSKGSIQNICHYINNEKELLEDEDTKIDSKLSNTISQNLLKYIANSCIHKSLLISFDGFDELQSSNDRSKIIKLLQFLRNDTKVKIWITTRMHYYKDLENALSTIAIKFNPMDKQSIKLFIVEYLKVRLSLILNHQVYKMKSLFKGDISTFIGIPLQLHLLLGAKGFIDNFVQWTYNTEQSFNFDYMGTNICNVYDFFIENEYDMFFKKMSYLLDLQPLLKSQFNDYCVELATETIFQLMFNKNKTLKFKEIFLSLGFIRLDEQNNLKFIHQTFNEYFAAEKCINWIEQNDIHDIKTKKIEFLNRFNNDTSLDEIYKHNGTIINKELNQKHSKLILDQEGYSVLDLAIEEGNLNIVNFLLTSCKTFEKKLIKKLILYKKNIFQMNALHIAVKYNNAEIFNKIIAMFETDKSVFFEVLSDEDTNGYSVLHLVVKENKIEIFDLLIPLFENNKNLLIELIKYENKYGDSILHLAAEYNNFKIIEKLIQLFDNNKIELFKWINHKNIFGDSILHLATRNNNIEIIEKIILLFDTSKNKLIEWIKDKNKYGDSILHLAAEYNNIEIIKKIVLLFDNNKSELLEWIEDKNKDGDSVLHLDVLKNNIKIIKITPLPNFYEIKSNIKSYETNATETIAKNQIFQPSSKFIKVDSNLKYKSNRYAPEFTKKDKVKQYIKIFLENRSNDNKFKRNTSYLFPYNMCKFANIVYYDYKDETKTNYMNLSEGWKFLTIAENNFLSNGYFGATFWNPEREQVVIAHRGISPTNLRELWTDIKSIYGNIVSPQMSSAVTFTHNPMLQQLQREFDVRYDNVEKLPIDCLDITSYLSAPNLINTCNPHVGKIYRVFIDFFNISFINQYHLFSLDKILNAFDNKTGFFKIKNEKFNIKEVVDWPEMNILNKDEYEDELFEWAKKLDNYYLISEEVIFKDYCKIRYQTKEFNQKQCSLNVFSQLEQHFLKQYQWVKQYPNFFNLNELFNKNHLKILDKLSINESNHLVSIQNESIVELYNTISYIRQLLIKFPEKCKILETWFSDKIDSQFNEKDFNELCDKHSNNKKMFWIKYDNEKFILQRLYNPDFYIERKFHSVSLNIDKKMFETDECFVFSGLDCVETLVDLFDDSSIKNNKNIYINQSSKDAEITFNRINNIVHWIEVKTIGSNNQLFWRDSKGSIQSIRQYINDGEFLENKDSLVDLIKDKQAIILADDPGMGKSTTLVQLYYSKLKNKNIKVFESNWIIHINLREHIQTIKSYFNDHKFNVDIIIKFLSKIDSKLSNNILQNLLKYSAKIYTNMPLLISFDGFDDLPDSIERDKIIELLKFLRNKTKVKIWITTQMNYCEALENALTTIAIKFSPMDKQSIKLFIVEYLKVRLSLILEYQVYEKFFVVGKNEFKLINEFTEQFFEKMEFLFKGNISRFIGSPLQLHLLLGVEGFIDNFVQWTYNTKQSFNFDYIGIDICEVYESFINKKFNIFFKKISHFSDVQSLLKSQFNDYCVELATENLFSLVSNKKKIFEFEKIFLSLGLFQLDKENKLKFIHQTFEEYYASEKCINLIIQKDELDISTKNIEFVFLVLKNDNHKVIRSFIDVKLN
ncbi:hypothetical protein BLOT_012331 [Blomia tropicalis]|nr:hypothetical protein BLOT_012331 [Blomia tropicalis]